jgi:hypothetical protein
MRRMGWMTMAQLQLRGVQGLFVSTTGPRNYTSMV